ncbi:MAG: methyltransferase domain-containing protein [Proteobacteria bacterium]|nr:methyltransferase domain-containing protein [Pseudomonadota bacterium]HQR03576.1 methyltransferase domain-containing protein [Rhodocyclaceae bacterium]
MSQHSSARYTHGHESSVLASHGARTAANSAAYLLPHLKPGMDILDVGCGPGTITLDLAALVVPGKVVGVENVEAPLFAARAEAVTRADSITTFQLGNAQELPFENETFDVVHAHQVLQHLTDPVTALREMVRVCKSGGWIAARDADYAAMSWYPEIPELDLWRKTYRAIAHSNGAQPDAGRRLRAWANAAGITDPQITASVWTYADAGSCQWWGRGQADRCAGPTFSRQANEQGLDEVAVAGIVQGWRKWSEATDAWFCMPHGELLARIYR